MISTRMLDRLDDVVINYFNIHPFSKISQHVDYLAVMSNYFAMSQAFPYLQAGSQKDLFFHYMEKNEDIPVNIELTTVVGNFLCWDETGGLYPTIALGLKALPKILETRRFHSNLLKSDLETLFKHPVSPSYSETTKKYLISLYDGLSSLCHINRVACMISFEHHANIMIAELWNSITKKFSVEKKQLSYFMLHVGGDDPAEKYHVAMTKNLIDKVILPSEQDSFIDKFKKNYELHYNWCNEILAL